MNQVQSFKSATIDEGAFLSAAFSPLQEHKTQAAWLPVGARARRLLRRIVLADRSRGGLIRLADQFFARPFLSLLRIIPLIRLVGPKARRDHGLSMPRQLHDLLRMVLVHGAKPAIYYLSECYRPGAMDQAGAIVMRNEIKRGVGKALNRIDPEARRFRRNLGDKADAAHWCAENGFPHPHPLMLVEDGEAITLARSPVDLERDLWAKRRDGRGAYMATPYRHVGPGRYRDRQGRELSLGEITGELLARRPRRSWIIVPMLHNHPDLADLAGESLITVRALTCLDERMRPVLTNLFLRSICKLEPGWKGRVGRIEEYGAPIDFVTGELGQITGDKPECLSEFFDRHPVTGAQVTGRVVPHWADVARMAIRAHAMLPGRVFVGWDFAITPQGPVLLEGNSFPDPSFPQRVFRKPIGHMRLGELLDFHLGRIEAKLGVAQH